jgi:hypothetical protein
VHDAVSPAGEGGILIPLHDFVRGLPVARLQGIDGPFQLRDGQDQTNLICFWISDTFSGRSKGAGVGSPGLRGRPSALNQSSSPEGMMAQNILSGTLPSFSM